LTFTTRDLPGKRRRIIIDFMFKPEQIPFSAVRTIAAKMDAPDIKLWGDHSAWDTAVPDQPRKLDQNLVPALAQYGLVEDDKDVHWLWCMQ
jgi:hypothetical protein